MELLLKPFQRPILHARHFAAATVLPTGRAALILNVAEVIESALALEDEQASAGPEPPPLAKQARDILVVDDSVTSRMLLKNILETAGYRVKTASDGLDALTALRTAALRSGGIGCADAAHGRLRSRRPHSGDPDPQRHSRHPRDRPGIRRRIAPAGSRPAPPPTS